MLKKKFFYFGKKNPSFEKKILCQIKAGAKGQSISKANNLVSKNFLYELGGNNTQISQKNTALVKRVKQKRIKMQIHNVFGTILQPKLQNYISSGLKKPQSKIVNHYNHYRLQIDCEFESTYLILTIACNQNTHYLDRQK